MNPVVQQITGDTQFSEEVWVEVLKSVDQTYQDLVSQQVALEQRNAELEDMRAFQASVLGAMTDVLLVCGPDCQVLEVNRAFLELTGASRERMIGRPVSELFEPQDRERLTSEMAALRRGGAVQGLELQLSSENGPAPLELNASPRFDARRRFIGAVLIGRSVGEIRQAYRELNASHRALQDTQSQLVHSEKLASLGRLLAGVAHELNNPISFVYGNAHALERYTQKFEEYFERVEAGAEREELIALRAEQKLDRAVRNMRNAVSGALEGAERVRDIVESLRRLSADGAGLVERFDLAEVARNAAVWVIKGRAVTTPLNVKADEPVRALGRPGHIQQVVMNLVQNALDAMEDVEDASVDMTIEAVDGMAVLEVADRGPGVSAENALKIFDPFFTTKSVGKGTGLGLSISYKIAEEHGGRLSVSPREGGGAVFRLELPLDGGPLAAKASGSGDDAS